MSDQVYVPKTPGAIQSAAENLEGKGKLTSKPGTPPSDRPRLRLRQAAEVAESLHVSTPGAQRPTPAPITPDLNNAVMELDIIDQMMPYDDNPRTERNPAFDDIKESIRQRKGLSGTLMVTRRPGEVRYMPYMGQNTRFAALMELWQETSDPCYRRIRAVFREWKSEADTFLSHVVENEVRGNTCWFDKAAAIVRFRELLEKERGTRLSASDVVNATQASGMSGKLVSRVTVGFYEFAVAYLSPLGKWLTKENAATLRPHLTSLEATSVALALQAKHQQAFLPALHNLLVSFRAAFDASAAQSEENLILRGKELDALIDQINERFCEVMEISLPLLPQVMAAVAEGASASVIADIAAGKTAASSACDAGSRTTPPASGTSSGRTGAPGDSAPPQQAHRAVVSGQSNARGAPHQNQTAKASPVDAGERVERDAPPVVTESSGQPTIDEESGAVGAGPRFGEALSELCLATLTTDFLCTDPELDIQYGFWLDLPPEIFGGAVASILDVPSLDGRVLSARETSLRASAFRFLAFLSGQLGGSIGPNEQDFARALPEGSLWRQAALVDSMSDESFLAVWQHQFHGLLRQDPSSVVLTPQWDDFTTLLHAPECGAQFVAFLDALQGWHRERAQQPPVE